MEAKWDRPPEFAQDGTPPPVQTAPTDLEVGYRVRTAESVLPGDPFALRVLLDDSESGDMEFSAAHNWLAGQLKANHRHHVATRDNYRLARAQRDLGRGIPGSILAAIPGGAAAGAVAKSLEWMQRTLGMSTYTGLLRWRYRTYWQRETDIKQVSRNNTEKLSISNIVGVSDTTLHEVAETLGIELGAKNGPKLSSALTEKFATSVTFTTQDSTTREMTLSGPTGSGKYRYYAFWRRRYKFEVDLLVVRDGALHWQNEQTADYSIDDAVIVTDTESSTESKGLDQGHG
ncbi:hypothetical protein GCM10027039_24430 [Terrabacter koreensis]